jgi:hypothetical protein
MSLRAAYTAEEWQTLQFGPLWVFNTVAGADQQIDKKEVEALAKELQEAPLYKDPLVREILLSLAGDLGDLMGQYQRDTRNVMVGLQDVARVLQKAPADNALAYKRAMLLIGGNVAKAAGGGIFQRDPISNEEKGALVMVAMWLGITP